MNEENKSTALNDPELELQSHVFPLAPPQPIEDVVLQSIRQDAASAPQVYLSESTVTFGGE